ncbi:Putative twin transmembrane helix small domain protein [Candidatus Bealeia paramacronuclearis]|uniref:Twin transmembrane helix small domain protein n=1 Tax=Candidatus Bealeia paramacronuclearis TaxID=1921001 RepID=A0ABZ2C7J3_9PROT|nr:putative twin transmembrane helix small domain protein [Candidatus Bealeia paramacronuclearis]
MTAQGVITVLLFIAMGATLLVLALGIANLFLKGTDNPERSNKLMRMRIGFQALALALFAILLLLKR